MNTIFAAYLQGFCLLLSRFLTIFVYLDSLQFLSIPISVLTNYKIIKNKKLIQEQEQNLHSEDEV